MGRQTIQRSRIIKNEAIKDWGGEAIDAKCCETNSDYKNQGLSIHTGVRQNGSQYIFVSFYIYKDGLPFWVAGNIDYLNGQSDVTVDLFEYEGSSFVTTENGLDDLQLSFGNLTITPIECNQIEVDILINNEQPLTLLMNRLTNNAKDGMCVD